MDPRDLDRAADNLEAQAADKDRQARNLVDEAAVDTATAADTRVRATSLRSEQYVAELAEREARDALKR